MRAEAAVLYAEPGSRWRALLFGPVFSGIGYAADRSIGAGLSIFAWAFVAMLISGVVALQVVAGRRHASVELTREALRQGTESVDLDEIAEVFPPVDPDRPRSEVEAWESARALGELRGVPRRRNGIGLRLSNGGLVQAWAIHDKALRSALEQALGMRP